MSEMETKKRLVVLGGGESGIGAAVLGKVKGMEVFLSDCGKIAPAILRHSTAIKLIMSKADTHLSLSSMPMKL